MSLSSIFNKWIPENPISPQLDFVPHLRISTMRPAFYRHSTAVAVNGPSNPESQAISVNFFIERYTKLLTKRERTELINRESRPARDAVKIARHFSTGNMRNAAFESRQGRLICELNRPIWGAIVLRV
jgi:hypothetical protein